ncbi:MAG: ATP-binding protein [Lachnospiraceae bacterium]|nr:ATP-binding protein [Lachnospiraceae bacterium]
MKKLILVVSPPACGKTFISKKIAETAAHMVYLDKDTLIPLSKIIFEVGKQEYNRSSDFFEEYIRNPEYDVILDLAYDALRYEDYVLVNAPFTREIHSADYLKDMKKKLHDKYNAELVIVWVKTSPETCHQRMIDRNSDRDTWKLEHWDEYIAGIDFNIPDPLYDKECVDELFIFNNSSENEYKESMQEFMKEL